MINVFDDSIYKSISSYTLPSYSEIPDVGLYLNQCATYINKVLEPLYGISITESMISNYVKKKIIENPIKKMYPRSTISELIFISITKNAAPLDSISFLLSSLREKYNSEDFYNYFKNEFESRLSVVFSQNDSSEVRGDSEIEILFKNLINTSIQIVHMDILFARLRGKDENNE